VDGEFAVGLEIELAECRGATSAWSFSGRLTSFGRPMAAAISAMSFAQ
jgi:hypothetical protein